MLVINASIEQSIAVGATAFLQEQLIKQCLATPSPIETPPKSINLAS